MVTVGDARVNAICTAQWGCAHRRHSIGSDERVLGEPSVEALDGARDLSPV